MRATSEQILSRIRTGEDGTTEFEELRLDERGVVSPKAEDVAAELVALANADGGLLLLGVDDAGNIAGIPAARTADVRRWIADVARNNCDPPIRPTINSERLAPPGEEERRVVVVEVPRGVFVHQTSGGRYYTRVGPTERRPAAEELARLFQERGRRFVFDEQIVFDTPVEALNRNRLEAFFGRSPALPWLDLLRNT